MKKFLLDRAHFIAELLISIIIIGLLLHFAGFEDFMGYVGNINLWWLALSVILLILMYFGMVLRIRIMLAEMGVKLGWMDTFRANLSGMLVADLTPARSGYMTTALVLNKKYHVPSEKAMVSILGPQMCDFIVKVGAGGVALFYLLSEVLKTDSGWIMYLGVFGISAMLAIMALLLYSKRFLGLFGFMGGWPVLGEVLAMFHRMQEHSGVVIRKAPEIIGLQAVTWSLKAFSWWAAAESVGIHIDFPIHGALFFYFFQPLVTMLEFIPTPTLAGMGLSETGGALVLGLMGVPVAQATAFMLVVRFKTFAVNIPGYKYAMDALKGFGKKGQGAGKYKHATGARGK
ncbi:MAG: lysylphosphatidylglycerol synthase transmembrane domain-containing protein [Candidatus ainarchaeum sp.]|nr:lysylphosphatidylglycerol synthase transmembrane domain-containing protein [Candidatus ainarchaeum sp.]